MTAGQAQPRRAEDRDSLLPGVAFAGQGVLPSAVTQTLSQHLDHPLVRSLIARMGTSDLAGWDLTDTRVSQPATYVAGLVAAEACLGATAAVPAVVGHSLGEITALAYAGVLDVEDGLDLTVVRGRLCHEVQRGRPGAMAALTGLEMGAVEWLRRQVVARCGGILDVAAVNERRQVVLSGDCRSVACLVELVEQTRGRAVVLPIGGAFHSPIMVEALPQWQDIVERTRFSPPRTRMVSCIDGAWHDSAEDFRDLLATALVLPVRWLDALEAVGRLGVRRLWEAGPGQGLRRLGRRSEVVEFVDCPQREGLAERVPAVAVAQG